MPKTKEEQREYDKQYYLKNKEKRKKQIAEYQFNNKEVISQQQKEYYKEYRKTESRKKSVRIAKWKQQGILCYDFNLLNDLFLLTNKCEFCNCDLYGVGNNKRCLDHDHNITDKFNIRGVLCLSCNFKDVLK